MVAMRAVCAALLCLAALGVGAIAGAARADEAPIVLYPFVWEGYQEYSKLRHPSAFAVSRDGSTYGYSYCAETRCKFNTDKKVALESCAESGGEDCVIFAVKRDIQVAYHVLDLTKGDGCPPPASAPDLLAMAVVPDIDNVVYDHSHDIAALTDMEKRGKTRVDPVDFELLGLTIHDFSMGDVGSGTTLVHGPNGETCAGMAPGKIHIRMTSNIYVASEFPDTSCLYRAVLEHEEKHQAVGRRLFRELAAHATRLLRDDLQQLPYVSVADSGMAGTVARARIEAAITTAYETFWQQYDAEQDRVDSPEEYARVANACPDARDYLD